MGDSSQQEDLLLIPRTQVKWQLWQQQLEIPQLGGKRPQDSWGFLTSQLN